MCNCKKAETLVERYGEQVAERSDSFVFFSKFLDMVFVGLVIAIAFPLMFGYWLIMNLAGRRPSVRIPRKMAEGINLAMERNGKTIQN